MKILVKIISSCLLSIMLITSVQAQKKGFAFGVKGGVNMSKLSMGDVFTTRHDEAGNPYLGYDGKEVKDNLKASFDTKTGFVGGVYARFGKTLFIQPEVLVSTKGGSMTIEKTDDNSDANQNVKFKYTNIDVPLLVGLKGGPFRVLAGPIASFRVGDNQSLSDAFRYYTSDVNKSISESTFGYQFGVGLDLGSFSLDVRREGTFTNIATFNVDGDSGSGSTTVKQKINSWQVTLGLKIF